jgi:Potential Monad-binding region of RPAP3
VPVQLEPRSQAQAHPAHQHNFVPAEQSSMAEAKPCAGPHAQPSQTGGNSTHAASSTPVDFNTSGNHDAKTMPRADTGKATELQELRSSAAGSAASTGRTSPLEGIDLPARPLRAPATSSDFEGAWRSMRGDVNGQAQYLLLVRPQSLPQVFKSSLTPAILEGIVEIVLKHLMTSDVAGDQEHGVQLLRHLSKVQRFAMNMMLLPGRKRKEVVQAWDDAVANVQDAGRKQALKELRSVYTL